MGILFWTFMIPSLVLSVFAIVWKKPLYLVLSSIIILPLSLYLAATPLFQYLGLLFPFLFIGSAFLLRRSRLRLSILLISDWLLCFKLAMSNHHKFLLY